MADTRQKLAQFWLRARYAGRAAARPVANAVVFLSSRLLAPVGFRDLLLLGGAGLMGYGLETINPAFALIVPGAIFVYVAIFNVKA
jgi:hypothetical protein